MPQTDLAILNWRREKSVFLGTESAAGGRELDLPAAHGGARARENRPHERAATLEPARARGCSTTRSGASCWRYCCPSSAARGSCPTTRRYWLGHPLVAPMMITGTWIRDRNAADGLARHDARQVALRLLSAVLDLRRLCAARDAIADLRALQARVPRVVGGHGLRLSAARADPDRDRLREASLQNQETDWDFAQDCLATHAPPGTLNTVTGVCGLAAMLWLYGVAWHRPLADTIASVGHEGSSRRCHRRNRCIPKGLTDGSVITSVTGGIRGSDPGRAAGAAGCGVARRRSTPMSPRSSPSGATGSRCSRSTGRACCAPATTVVRPSSAARGPTSSSATPRRGAASARRSRRRAITRTPLNAFRKAKQYDPNDRTLDAAIERSQKGIVGDFLNRYRK